MGRARFEVSYEHLRELLSLPEDTVILGVAYKRMASFYVLIEHEDLPEVDLIAWPILTPVFRQQPSVVLEDWGTLGEIDE